MGLSNGNGLWSGNEGLAIPSVGLWSGQEGLTNTGTGSVTVPDVLTDDAGTNVLTNDAGTTVLEGK